MKDFKGRCKGIRLVNRGNGDAHVCVRILTHDDGNWFVDEINKTSSYWTLELVEQLNMAIEWMKENCDPDISIHDGRQYGYKFKPTQL